MEVDKKNVIKIYQAARRWYLVAETYANAMEWAAILREVKHDFTC